MRCRLLVFNQQVQLNLFNGNRGRYSADEMVTLAAELTASSPVTVQWTSYESSGKWQPLSGHLTQLAATFLLFYFIFFQLSHVWQVVYLCSHISDALRSPFPFVVRASRHL